MTQLPHIPALRGGEPYESLDTVELLDAATGSPAATVSQVNSGLIRRDLLKIESARLALDKSSTRDLIEICRRAAAFFLDSTLPQTPNLPKESPQEYIERLSASTGLPHNLCRSNMAKIHLVLSQMDTVLNGLTRDLPFEIFDHSLVEVDGLKLSFYSIGNCLGVVLPSNSPGVNSLWLPCLTMKIPVVLKPGRNDPWTPFRIVRSLIEAGYPQEAFYFYPSDHEGSDAILGNVDRGIVFGGDSTVEQYAANPRIQVHGPGRSKVLIGRDWADRWEAVLDVLVESIASNSGRSCINASSILVPKHADEIAEAVAVRLARIVPLGREDREATLAGFTEAAMVDFIDQTIESGLGEGGGDEVTSRHRSGSRVMKKEGLPYVLPTIVRCPDFGHPLANTEFLFPYASVVELPQEKMLDVIGYSLVVTAITSDPDWRGELLRSRQIDRLNLGPTPTSHVEWDQPHEGNLFEFLYRRRAIHEV